MKLAETVTFGTSGLDRAAHLRGDPEALAALRAAPEARTIPVWKGKLLTLEEGGLAWLPMDAWAQVCPPEERVFLGLDDGAPRFAVDVSHWKPEEGDPHSLGAFTDPSVQVVGELDGDPRFAELRAIMTLLSRRDAELAATAKAILGWHVSHRFCAACGAASEPVMAGWQRNCPSCGTHHFPRTDPVVIMLITRGNSLLMGRSPHWPEKMFSLLAGFVEPGETLEAAVRREVMEETSVQVGPVRYLASQPWPFPASLMFGCHGEAESEAITVDPVEIEEARWVTRETLMEVFAGRDDSMSPARPGAIARFLMENWLADRLD